jgi:DNA-binding transcriptional MerR regulator
MRIGELGERAGVSPRTLRHYDELGLLPAGRAANGYRCYDDADLRAVAEIRTLVAVYRRKLTEVDASLARLAEIRAELQAQLAAALLQRPPVPRCALTPSVPAPEESS